jgi:uncharacterized membrane protein YidH (DUF202 family)
MARPLDEDDEGLAPERTALAWNRSALAFFVVLAALGRRVWPLDEGQHAGAVVILGAAALLFLASIAFAGRLAPAGRYRGETMDPRAYVLVTVATVAIAAAGFVLALVPA